MTSCKGRQEGTPTTAVLTARRPMALRKTFFASIAVLAAVGLAQAARAESLTIGSATYRTGNGGEFTVRNFSGGSSYYAPVHADVLQHEGSNANFNTFCLEYSEHISLNGNYNYTIDDRAYSGGGGASGVPASDPIGTATAKLYYAFWSGQLDEFSGIQFDYDNADGNRAAHGQQLQIALWALEQESGAGGAPTPSAGSLAQALVNFANDVSWEDLGMGDWMGIGNVRVLNLYTSSGSNAQSQLIVVPLPPGALMGSVLLAGLGVVSLVRRRRRLADVY
jgi:hypothetical protein